MGALGALATLFSLPWLHNMKQKIGFSGGDEAARGDFFAWLWYYDFDVEHARDGWQAVRM